MTKLLNEPLKEPTIETREYFEQLGFLRTHYRRALKDLAQARKRANDVGFAESIASIDSIQRSIYVEDARAFEKREELRRCYKGLGY